MKIKLLYTLLFASMLLNEFNSPALAQTDDDVEGFLKAGQYCYNQGKLDEAALEFENVLIIDKKNFLARVWLAQIYIDKKDLVNARRLLTEASLQAPDHPKVMQLQQLLGNAGENVKPKLVDHVIAETIDGIASATKSRDFGIVIPEDKVTTENLEKKLLTFDNETIDEKKEVKQTIEKHKAADNLDINKYLGEDKSPLAAVFQIRQTYGLSAALDKYFEMVIDNPTLASKDDRGLVDEGIRVYYIRFQENDADPEARYYYGALQYMNGIYDEAEKILSPLRNNAGAFAKRLAPIYEGIDKWRAQENERIMAEKRLEAERLALEKKAEEEEKEAANDVWTKVKNKGKTASGSKDLADPGNKADAAKLHSEGYALYKKGKLDEAIAKYDEALAKDADNPEFSYHLGLAWTDKGLAGDNGAFDRAITAYQRVISLDPDSKLAKDANSMINDLQQAKHTLGEK